MSDTPTITAPAPRPFFKPWTLLLGFVAGLALLSFAGRTVIKRDLHPTAVRFHPMIAPDSQYEPTMGEMRAFVRARCRPDQILVIVGGNSILLGVGQPADRVWTKRLQENLGDRFAVVNLAFRGSSPTDGGAFVAEYSARRISRQIYVANVAPIQAADPIGIESYRFILLDAYYKNLLLPCVPRDEELKAYFAAETDHARRFERRLGARIDAWLHYRDFWNWWSCTRFFTFPNPLIPDAARDISTAQPLRRQGNRLQYHSVRPALLADRRRERPKNHPRYLGVGIRTKAGRHLRFSARLRPTNSPASPAVRFPTR